MRQPRYRSCPRIGRLGAGHNRLEVARSHLGEAERSPLAAAVDNHLEAGPALEAAVRSHLVVGLEAELAVELHQHPPEPVRRTSRRTCPPPVSRNSRRMPCRFPPYLEISRAGFWRTRR